jgi:putative oxidoreductase
VHFLKSILPDLSKLFLRIAAGLMLLHGSQKIMNYSEWAPQFGDPIGLGPELSLSLCIFAEFFCTIFLMLGLFTRTAIIPLIFNMCVIVFLVHAQDPLKDKELAVIFLLLYLAIYTSGPGKFSLDRFRRNGLDKLIG